MKFISTKLKGVYLIDLDLQIDERGFFARSWCQREFAEHGLDPRLVQCNISFNRLRGTLRGMHLQLPPSAEVKVVRCTQGAIFDVVIDLRSNSSTYLDWLGVELTAENRQAIYIPEGCAHGFQTLVDDSEIFYQMSEFYAPDFSRGVRWNDPVFNITWPLDISVISDRDLYLQDYDPNQFKIVG